MNRLQVFNAKGLPSFMPDIAAKMPVFLSQNADDTVSIGRAFAHAVRSMRALSALDGVPIRIGIIAPYATGKTTFVRGLLSALDHYQAVEEIQDSRWQATRKHVDPQQGWLRNYDASIDDNGGLPSYLANDISEFGLPFIDIAEHPNDDYYNQWFHSLILLQRPDMRTRHGIRKIGFLAARDIKATGGFQRFIAQAEPFREKTHPAATIKPSENKL